MVDAKVPASERNRLGLVITNPDDPDNFSTWSIVSARWAAACNANHLSSTSASSWKRVVEGLERGLSLGRRERHRARRARLAGPSCYRRRRIAPWPARPRAFIRCGESDRAPPFAAAESLCRRRQDLVRPRRRVPMRRQQLVPAAEYRSPWRTLRAIHESRPDRPPLFDPRPGFRSAAGSLRP